MVRKIVSWVLVGLGAFLLVAALMTHYWAPGMVKKTPESVDTTTYLRGDASVIDPEAGEAVPHEVKATSITETDTGLSNDDRVVWVSTTCLVIQENDPPDCVDGDDERLVNASVEVFASDRETALAISDPERLPEEAEPREGLVNKWPFDSEKKDYPYWDSMLGEPVTAEYVGTEEYHGVETYEYRAIVDETEAEVSEGIDGLYSSEKHIFVEPRTGSIIRQTQEEQRTTEDGDVLLDLDIEFTEEQVEGNAAEAEENISSLDLVTSTVPIIGYIVGPLLLIVGIALLMLGAAKRGGRRASGSDRVDGDGDQTRRQEPVGR